MTIRTDAPITTKHLLHKFGSTNQHIALTANAADCPLGKVQDRPVASGTYWYVGICVEQPAAGDGDVILVQHCVPVRVVIP